MSVAVLWLMSAIGTIPPAVFVSVLTSTAAPIALPLASTGVRNNCTVAPTSTNAFEVGLLIVTVGSRYSQCRSW